MEKKRRETDSCQEHKTHPSDMVEEAKFLDGCYTKLPSNPNIQQNRFSTEVESKASSSSAAEMISRNILKQGAITLGP